MTGSQRSLALVARQVSGRWDEVYIYLCREQAQVESPHLELLVDASKKFSEDGNNETSGSTGKKFGACSEGWATVEDGRSESSVRSGESGLILDM